MTVNVQEWHSQYMPHIEMNTLEVLILVSLTMYLWFYMIKLIRLLIQFKFMLRYVHSTATYFEMMKKYLMCGHDWLFPHLAR